jgi:hypothetical protein
MFDRRTRSLWPQPLGKAVLGALLGSELEVLASALLPWKEVRDAHPDVTVVLGSDDELGKTANPYDGYDTSAKPFLPRQGRRTSTLVHPRRRRHLRRSVHGVVVRPVAPAARDRRYRRRPATGTAVGSQQRLTAGTR